jgi:two-component system sensor histidine kinase CpxA
VLTFAAMVTAAALDADSGERRRPPFAMIALQFAEARRAYETGGPEMLQNTLERFRAITRAQGVLTDNRGRDLATGEDRSDLVRAVLDRPRMAFMARGRAVIGRRSLDGRYYFFLLVPRANWLRWFFQPEVHLTMLAVLALFSFAFARHLTNPVRRLQHAVERFGKGDFSARVRSERKDEIGQLARTFDRMADRIETLLAAERRLLLDISHELRSPLARLSVATELARSNGGDQKHLDRIEKEAGRLNSLVGELLQVTRAEGDQANLRRDEIALEALLDEIVQDVRVEAEARGCRVEFTSREPVTLEGDPELMRRAIENVVRNAVRYAPAETAVEVSLRKDGEQAVVSVRDYGPGVPAGDTVRIFDAFYRVDQDRNRSSGGVGLGLSIARRAIELHQGQISARNTAPGLLVEIRVPVTLVCHLQ